MSLVGTVERFLSCYTKDINQGYAFYMDTTQGYAGAMYTPMQQVEVQRTPS